MLQTNLQMQILQTMLLPQEMFNVL